MNTQSSDAKMLLEYTKNQSFPIHFVIFLSEQLNHYSSHLNTPRHVLPAHLYCQYHNSQDFFLRNIISQWPVGSKQLYLLLCLFFFFSKIFASKKNFYKVCCKTHAPLFFFIFIFGGPESTFFDSKLLLTLMETSMVPNCSFTAPVNSSLVRTRTAL